MPDHLTCLLRNLLCRSRSNSRNQTWNNRLVPNWEMSTSRLYIATLLNFYAEYIMRNAGLDEAQAGIKSARRNINNLRYVEGEVKSLWMKVKEESEKAGLILNIKKTKIMASGPMNSLQIEGGNVEAVTDFIFLSSNITQMVTAAMK